MPGVIELDSRTPADWESISPKKKPSKKSPIEIEDTDILRRTTGRIRFFSIDGCHFYQHVENDLRLAERTLTAEGIIAVDDFFNKDWPDASFAAYDFIRQTDAIVPFAITSSKLYLAAPRVAEQYKTALSKRADLAQNYCVQILGREVSKSSTKASSEERIRPAPRSNPAPLFVI